MRWTNRKPNKEGWYWWKASTGDAMCIHHFETICHSLVWTTNENDDDIDELGGKWAGPLIPPDDQAKEEG